MLVGQNRLVSLAWAAFNPDSPLEVVVPESQAAVWRTDRRLTLDLQTGVYDFLTREQALEGLKIPAYAVFSAELTELNPMVRKLWGTQWKSFDDAHKNRAMEVLDHCIRAVREAQCVRALLEHATENEAREAFLHVHRVKASTSGQDFFDSASSRSARLLRRAFWVRLEVLFDGRLIPARWTAKNFMFRAQGVQPTC